MNETWLPVDGFPYEVSSQGRVRRKGSTKTLSLRKHTNGYIRVCFSVDGVHTDAYVHRLVCHAFHGPAGNPTDHADHINSVRDDNRAANLRWLSPEKNRALRKFRFGSASNPKLSVADVLAIRAMPFKRGQDQIIANQMGVCKATIRDVRLGKRWRHVR